MDVQWRVLGIINNTQAPSPNLLKLPAHSMGPLPAPRCEYNRSNTPETQSAHPLSNAHTSLLLGGGGLRTLSCCVEETALHYSSFMSERRIERESKRKKMEEET